MEQPYPGRLRWEHPGGDAVRLRLRPQRAWHDMLGVAFFAGILVANKVWRPIFWHSFADAGGGAWLFGLCFGLLTLLLSAEVLWQLLSQETLTGSPDRVEISRQLLGLTFFRCAFAPTAIQALLLTEEPAGEAAQQVPCLGRVFGFEGGTLFFSLPAQGVAFGRHLAPAEARAALRELRRLQVLSAAVVAPALAAL